MLGNRHMISNIQKVESFSVVNHVRHYGEIDFTPAQIIHFGQAV